MQLLSVGLAKSIWLFDVNEINPGGKMIFPDALKWLAEQYSFQKYPASITDFGDGKENQKGFIFKTGSFQVEGKSVMVDFSIFTDGVVADTWASTETGDLFIEELLRSAAKRYDLPFNLNLVRKKLYISELVVRMENPFARINQSLDRFNITLDRLFLRHNLPPYQVGGMSFMSDTSETSYKPPGFVIERKIGSPYSDNRFWSKSPFTTADHLNALEEFERVLGGG